MSLHRSRAGIGAVFPAAFSALQWRLLLLWLLGLALPTLVATLPVARLLGSLLDNSVHAPEWARQFDINAFGDTMYLLGKSGPALSAGVTIAIVLAVLLSPLLSGFSLTAARAARSPGFGELVHGGIAEYWRLFRLMLVALIPVGLAVAIGAGAMSFADKHTENAILSSDVDRANHLAMGLMAVLFVVAHATVEAARGQFAADGHLRSAFRAWGRGVMLVLRRPVASLGIYLLLTAAGLGLAYLMGVWRIGIPRAGTGGYLFALLVTQLIALSLAWMRTARLFAFAEIGKR